MNAIVKATARLVQEIRKADVDTLKDAANVLQSFGDAWLVLGDGDDLPGAKNCCLADTDTTAAVLGALNIMLDNTEGGAS